MDILLLAKIFGTQCILWGVYFVALTLIESNSDLDIDVIRGYSYIIFLLTVIINVLMIIWSI